MKGRGSAWVGLVLVGMLVLTGCGGFAAEVIDAAPAVESSAPVSSIVVEATEAAVEVADVGNADIDADAVADVAEEAAEISTPESTLIALDDEMYLYTNPRLGFSIKMPQQMALFFGGCTYNEEQSSYRPEFAVVSTTVFEQGDTAYLTFSRYAELQGKTVTTYPDGGQRATFAGCAAMTNTLEVVLDPEQPYKQLWAIQVVTIQDRVELTQFIRSRYGEGCAVGEMTATSQEGVYDVAIQGDGKHFTESACPINFRTVVKYDETRQKVAAWDLGQAHTFAADLGYQTIYDHDMVDSFRFID